MSQAAKPADEVVAAFIADSDQVFTAAYDALPMAEQRRIYDAYWQRYHAPRPVGVTVETIEIAGPNGKCRAILYRPPQIGNGAEALPIVVYFHGGGFMLGSTALYDTTCRRLAVSGNCAVLSVDYRLAPETQFPGAVLDAYAATRWASASAESSRPRREPRAAP